MANGFLVLNEHDWEKASPEQQNWMTFRTLKSIDARLSKLEKRPVVDKLYAFMGGIIGGIVSFFGVKLGGING